MDLNNVRIDPLKEAEGAWITIDDETSVKVARMFNVNYVAALEKVAKTRNISPANRTSLIMGEARAGEESQEDKDALTRVIADTILLDWKGLKIDGKDVPYSPEKCFEVLANPDYLEFRRFVLTASDNAEYFRAEEVRKSLGESGGMLDG